VVVPSPATSSVFLATSLPVRHRSSPTGSSSSMSFAIETPSLVIVGAPHFFSSTTLRPRGPSVTLTASTSWFIPLSSAVWRARRTPICFRALSPVLPLLLGFPRALALSSVECQTSSLERRVLPGARLSSLAGVTTGAGPAPAPEDSGGAAAAPASGTHIAGPAPLPRTRAEPRWRRPRVLTSPVGQERPASRQRSPLGSPGREPSATAWLQGGRARRRLVGPAQARPGALVLLLGRRHRRQRGDQLLRPATARDNPSQAFGGRPGGGGRDRDHLAGRIRGRPVLLLPLGDLLERAPASWWGCRASRREPSSG